MALWDSQAERAVMGALRRAKEQARDDADAAFDVAVDYLNGNMLRDIEAELYDRHTNAQSGVDRIAAVPLPLVERYADEVADAYNKPVHRELVHVDSREVDEDATKQLHDVLDGADERLHAMERIKSVLRSCGLWFQAKRGAIHLRPAVPQRIRAVLDPDNPAADPADQRDYAGFVVELSTFVEDASISRPRNFVYIMPDRHVYYEAEHWAEPLNFTGEAENPLRWPQTVDNGRGGGTTRNAPLQMMTIWHESLPVDELIPTGDIEIVHIARELSIQFSVLLDTIRTQGHSQMVANLLNAETAPQRMAAGSRFMLAMRPGESAQMISSSVSYSDIVAVLEIMSKLIPILKRQDPNGFAFSPSGPESGFAKLVASLPKLEAREQRIRRLVAMEQNYMWPRVGATGKHLGLFGFDPTKYRMRTKFADIEFPQSVDERARGQEHDFKYGLDSPVHVLMRDRGISKEEAEELYTEHMEASKSARTEPQQSQPSSIGGSLNGLFGSRVGRAQRDDA